MRARDAVVVSCFAVSSRQAGTIIQQRKAVRQNTRANTQSQSEVAAGIEYAAKCVGGVTFGTSPVPLADGGTTFGTSAAPLASFF